MPYSDIYSSPLARMLMQSEDGGSLSLLSFLDDGEGLQTQQERNPRIPLFEVVKCWLDIYFSGNAPPFTPQLSLQGRGTELQRAVWDEVMQVPYGKTATYGEIARRLSEEKKRATSPRAVGNALARNPIAIIVPCHRVLAANGALSGYKWGVDRKQALLLHEAMPAASLQLPATSVCGRASSANHA